MKLIFTCIIVGFMVVNTAVAIERIDENVEVSFSTSDQGTVHAFLQGDGNHAVVLAHGAIFNKESWKILTKLLVANGLTTLAVDFRGYGKSKPGSRPDALHEDILAAVRYLHQIGAQRV